jgi:two-component system sensor histidine kinase BaeS
MRGRLVGKLLGIIALVIVGAMVTVWVAIDFFAADYFMFLMEKYKVPQEVKQVFLDAAHRYLAWSGLVALTLALSGGFFLISMVLGPLRQMIVMTRKIAQGDYTSRVQLSSNDDEVGQLAVAFNRMTDRLEQVEHLRRTMVLDVAHELRAPLTNMRGYLEALSDGVLPPSRGTFQSLHEETLRLVTLAEDLLQLSQADAARATLRPQEVDLAELLSRSLELFRSQLEGKGIVVETRLDGGQARVRADPHRLAQVLGNLLQNAWQYTPEGGRLGIDFERSAGWAKLVFTNSGDPIAAEDIPFIFERFYRGEKSRSRSHGGAGIGLAIVKELVEAHGGDVGVESAVAGTRVWFRLPA